MFKKISTAAYDAACYDQGEEDFLRTVPCPKGQLCPEEDNPLHVVKGHQLTYRIQDLATSRFENFVISTSFKKSCVLFKEALSNHVARRNVCRRHTWRQKLSH